MSYRFAARGFLRPYLPAHRRASLVLTAALALTSCAVYHPKPLLPQQTALDVTALGRLRIDPAKLPPLLVVRHRFDPSDGLDVTETAMLAVVNNPDLRLARDDVGVAQAQAFAAHLLPDPQIALTTDIPAPPMVGNNLTGYSVGLTYDLMTLMTHDVSQDAAQASARQTDLGLLWQEWQVIARARQLFLKVTLDRQTLPLREKVEALTLARFRAYADAERSQDLTGDSTMAAWTAWQDASNQLNDAQRQASQNLHDFDLLLGLAAGTDLPLQRADVDDNGEAAAAADHVASRQPRHDGSNGSSGSSDSSDSGSDSGSIDDGARYGEQLWDVSAVSDREMAMALRTLPRRRPDLLALQAGYEAEEAKTRLAIWNQFPTLNVGFNRASDNSAVKTDGFQIGFNLPIFNRNRGNIAIEQATRQRLHDDYQNRVDSAYAEVAQARRDARLLAQQWRAAVDALPRAQQEADRIAKAYARADTTLGVYTDAAVAALGRQIQIAILREGLDEQRVLLTAVLGPPLADTARETPNGKRVAAGAMRSPSRSAVLGAAAIQSAARGDP